MTQLELFPESDGPQLQITDFYKSALDVFEERNEKYGDAWRKAGLLDSLGHIRSKARRLEVLEQRLILGEITMDEARIYMDDMIDLGNYSGFAWVNTEEGRR